MPVHSTALVDPAAKIDPGADIGPWCIVGPEVEIGARTRLMAHVFVEGPTVIGEDNIFYPYSTVGVSAAATGSGSSSPFTAARRAAGSSPRLATIACS